MPFLQNTWYVAAWAKDVSRIFLTREILSQPVLMYRRNDGAPVAIMDRCPHRFAPLHMGRLIGDTVECGYHGLQFDCSGKCTHNPHGPKIPANAQVRAYPVVEQDGLIWIWMGDVARADSSLIPDFSYLTSEGTKTIANQMVQEAHYELIVDNLMDLSHVNYLHSPYQKVDGFLDAHHEIIQAGNVLDSVRSIASTFAPPSFRPFMQDPQAAVEYWLSMRWFAPGACQLETGVTPVGAYRDKGLKRIGTHIVTPETETRTRYFYASTRNYQLNDPKADEETQNWHQIGFHQQDKPMIEGVQQRMGTTNLNSLNPVLLPSDVAAVRARRILASMIQAELSMEETREPASVK